MRDFEAEKRLTIAKLESQLACLVDKRTEHELAIKGIKDSIAELRKELSGHRAWLKTRTPAKVAATKNRELSSEARCFHAHTLRATGYKLRQIADELGVSTTRVQQMLQKADRLLRFRRMNLKQRANGAPTPEPEDDQNSSQSP